MNGVSSVGMSPTIEWPYRRERAWLELPTRKTMRIGTSRKSSRRSSRGCRSKTSPTCGGWLKGRNPRNQNTRPSMRGPERA